ncbi:nucleotide exchange factor GrpE [uncultured Pseudodesulfovibrio sp.]|uniref:nucleotide exchange factor GrpE n=1 Tax=uncultured Pseudodesulfovibrio sp. TaxID=2035858 RepID=UPI0029C6F5E8|nr:nucleotide exchange factor GrpE [uncultured Pseudodesulfovibrio sp.]
MVKKKQNTEVPINGLYDEDGKLFGEDDQAPGFEATDADAEDVEEVTEEEEVSLSQEELVALCRESVCPECDVHKEAEGIRLRALADAENVKKRLLREAEELKKYAGESVLADLLPVLDNLDLALAHTDNLDAACKNFVIGVDMTRKLFLDAVKSHGLEAVEAARGTEFNPEKHEAVGTVEEDDLGDNVIAQVVQGGYILKGRLLRPAKVMVNKA